MLRKPNLVVLSCTTLILLLSLVQLFSYASLSDEVSFEFIFPLKQQQEKEDYLPLANITEKRTEKCLLLSSQLEQQITNIQSKLDEHPLSPSTTTAAQIGQFRYPESDLFQYSDITQGQGSPRFHLFISEFVNLYLSNKQTINHPERTYTPGSTFGRPTKKGGDVWKFDPTEIISEQDLNNALINPPDFIELLTKNHKNMVNGIPSRPPYNFYSGKGYLFNGGGLYTWQSLINIKLLRQLGSVLPVELMILNESEYDKVLCDEILPSLNARCIVLSTVFGEENLSKLGELGAFQYKSFGTIVSSFNEVLLLDADAMPLINPDYLFESGGLFDQFGMIIWPDVIRRTTSPDFFKVQGITVHNELDKHVADIYTDPKYYTQDTQKQEINYTKDVNFHDRRGVPGDWSTDSGSILIRKSTHFDVLLLALYYNLDGPTGYYPLLSTFGPGEGDKESWVMAANYYGKLWYQVTKTPQKGNLLEDRSWNHACTLQADPIEEFEKLKWVYDDIKTKLENGEKYDYLKMFHEWFKRDDQEDQKFLYYHVHYPHWDPFEIMDGKQSVDGNGEHIRNLERHEKLIDLELRVYEIMDELLCVNQFKFTWLEQEMERRDDIDNDLCGFLKEKVDYLKSTSWELV